MQRNDAQKINPPAKLAAGIWIVAGDGFKDIDIALATIPNRQPPTTVLHLMRIIPPPGYCAEIPVTHMLDATAHVPDKVAGKAIVVVDHHDHGKLIAQV